MPKVADHGRSISIKFGSMMGGGGGGESESAYSVFIPTGTPSLCYHYQTSVQIGVNLGERQILISVSYSRNFPGIDSVSRMNSVCWGSL